MHSHTVNWINKQITYTRMAIAPKWRSQVSITPVTSRQIKCMRKHNHTASPSPQFACPQRGRKRLSREAILRTELALEWPELVQIGRCKVQWLPNDANKRILSSFYSKNTIYTTATLPHRLFAPWTNERFASKQIFSVCEGPNFAYQLHEATCHLRF